MTSRRIVVSLLAVLVLGGTVLPGASPLARERITGAGASFPFPLYSNWFKAFSRAHPDVIVDYQSKGSGAGVRD
ncbi:MAG TPA: substrate-binding domain-containing protein, partial [Sandaracinaceae bacterium LLY-WYZ-13_1]|nr:substrate-binding domain-containing protein [Sandaracinaceae bacterium LLY-WYZ-13_1]